MPPSRPMKLCAKAVRWTWMWLLIAVCLGAFALFSAVVAEAAGAKAKGSKAVSAKGGSAKGKTVAAKGLGAKGPTAKAAAGKGAAKAAKEAASKSPTVKGKAARRATKDAKAGDESDEKPLSKAEKAKKAKQDAALRKTCGDKKKAKTAACKAFAVAEKERGQEVADAKQAKRCSTAKARKTLECKKYLSRHAKSGRDACGRKYARAKKNEAVARFAKRNGLSEAALRKFNDLTDKTKKLRGGARYLVAKSPHDGVTLSGGVQLTDQSGVIKLRRPNLAFGKPMLVSVIEAAATAVQASSPLGVTLMVGDLSKDGGGCLPPHKSHRGGLDADIGFYFRGGYEPKVLADAQAETIDADRTWQFLRGLLATGRLQYAFIHYDLQPALLEAALRAGETPESAARLIQYPRPIEQARETPIRHLDGHDDHMHVRFACADELCQLSDEEKAAIAGLRLETLGGPTRERHARGMQNPLRARQTQGHPLR